MKMTKALWTIEIPAKLSGKEQGIEYANRLINKFSEMCRLNNDYEAQVMIGISRLNGKLIDSVYYNKGKKEVVVSEDKNKIRKYGRLKQKWHFHILALTEPSEAFARKIKEYINKNWNVKVYIKYVGFKDKEKQYIDVDFLGYMARQSEVVRFYCSDKNKFNGFSLKELYNEYLKVQTAEKNNKYIINETDKRYNEIKSYFNGVVEDKIKRLESKIDKVEEINEVQKIKYEKNEYDKLFKGF